MSVTVSFDLSDIRRSIERACKFVRNEGGAVAYETSDEATEWVKENHGYTDRTHKLTDSIKWVPVRSSDTRIDCTIMAGGKDAPYAIIINDGSKPHEIYGKPVLRFEIEGSVIYARKVNHPGTRPYGFMSQCYDKATRVALVKLEELATKVEAL